MSIYHPLNPLALAKAASLCKRSGKTEPGNMKGITMDELDRIKQRIKQ
jgi:hypothetical protein